MVSSESPTGSLCPACARDAHVSELLYTPDYVLCPRCCHCWRKRRLQKMCDACGRRAYAVQTENTFWCVRCFWRFFLGWRAP